MFEHEKILKKGKTRKQELECPNCGSDDFEVYEKSAQFISGICKIPAACNACTCMFQLIYFMNYIHSRVEVEGNPPQEKKKEATKEEDEPVFKNAKIIFDPTKDARKSAIKDLNKILDRNDPIEDETCILCDRLPCACPIDDDSEALIVLADDPKDPVNVVPAEDKESCPQMDMTVAVNTDDEE